MPQPPVSSGVMLDRAPSQITVTDMQIVEPASLQFSRGGCDRPGSVIKAELVNVRTGALQFVPMNIKYAEALHKQLGELITEHNRRALEE